jgi:sucrose phosphorylase
LIKIRKNQPAFHPNAPFEILDIDPRVFAIRRQAEDQTIYALTNLSSQRVPFLLSDAGISGPVNDLLTSEVADAMACELRPYQYVWLTPSDR